MFVACLFLLASQPAGAGTWTLNVENDKFTRKSTDQHYTNGVRIGWVSEAKDGDNLPLLRDTLQTLYPLATVRSGRLGLELGHNIYTPADTQATTLQVDDRPYAGWLYASASLYAETAEGFLPPYDQTLDRMALEIGIVGPSALGKQVQNGYHKMIDVETAKGWDHQLKDEPGINLIGERKYRHVPLRFAGLEADAIPHIGGSLGNVYTHLNGGMTLRIGQQLSIDYGPPLIRPSPSGFGAIEGTTGFAWYAFAGVDGRWVLRNIFLDGNTFRDSHSVDRKELVGDFISGVAVTYGAARLAFTHVMRTREFEGQTSPDRFGAISLSLRF